MGKGRTFYITSGRMGKIKQPWKIETSEDEQYPKVVLKTGT